MLVRRLGRYAGQSSGPLNFAAATTGPMGYLTAWPAGQSKPLVASLNDPTGTVLANAVVVLAGTGGAADVFFDRRRGYGDRHQRLLRAFRRQRPPDGRPSWR